MGVNGKGKYSCLQLWSSVCRINRKLPGWCRTYPMEGGPLSAGLPKKGSEMRQVV